MVSFFTNFWLSFLAGLFAPLGAVCVLPLYPGFLSYLASQVSKRSKKNIIFVLGVMVMLGVISSMLLFGLIFTQLLQNSLTEAISIISPIAFGLLGIISILLICNVDVGRLFPKIRAPVTKSPYRSSFMFGFFFGGIVLPCNPASLIVLFALSTSTVSFAANFFNFIFFGLGMGLPLLVFAAISAAKSTQVIGWLTRHKRSINVVSGVIMLGISLYYLFFVFRVLT
jgi:cytochrome c-type biogenesis protein